MGDITVLYNTKSEWGATLLYSVVLSNASINHSARIGTHCTINTSAVIEHDNVMEAFAHNSVGAKLGGTVHVGKSIWIGIGATVINNVGICSECTIGAGAVVIKIV